MTLPSRSARRTEPRRPLPSAVGVRAIPSRIAAVPRPVRRCPALFANASRTTVVEQKPAVSRPSAASTNSRTLDARSSGVAAAVASSQWSTAGASPRGARPGQSGSGGRTRAASRTPSVARTRLSSSAGPSTDVDALRPSSTATRIRTWLISDATFWWMNPVANRVSASLPRRTETSTSASGARARTRSTTWSARSRPRAASRSAVAIDRRRSVVVIVATPGPRPGRRGSGRVRMGGRCGRSAGAGPCRSSGCPRRSTRRGCRACPSSPRTAG